MSCVAERLKVCGVCGKRKPINEFHRCRGSADGLQRWCIVCSKTRRKELWPDRSKPQIRSRSAKYRLRLRFEVLEHYSKGSPKCACPGCSENHIEFLSLDHIAGGGAKERKQTGRVGASHYRWLKLNGYPIGYRVLCHNCNQALGLYGYCPHQLPTPTVKPVSASLESEQAVLAAALSLFEKGIVVTGKGLASLTGKRLSTVFGIRTRLAKAGRWSYEH